jgi:hypothetical protein
MRQDAKMSREARMKNTVRRPEKRGGRKTVWRPLAAITLISVLVGGCVQVGPKVLSSGRPLYNVAVQESESQQMLMNIVRQRYSDPVLFLDVTSISSSFRWEASAGLLGTFNQSGNDSGIGQLGGVVGESPFITYAPNTGEQFVRQMLTPIDLRTVALIVQAGWSIERVMLIIGQSINEVRNNPTATDPDTGFGRYREVVSALRDLQRSGSLSVGAEAIKDSENPDLMLMIDPDAIGSSAYRTVCESINVACDGSPLQLRQAIGASSDGKSMAVATRSLFSALYYLGQAIDVPEADLAYGSAQKPASGTARDNDALHSVFHIRSSDSEPERAAVKVFYRGSWFYIADNDADSKTTFALISMLHMLQSGETSKITPLITLPVN